jgi:hypothetical protein
LTSTKSPLPGPGHNNGTNGRIALKFPKRSDKFISHGTVPGIQRFWTVQSDEADIFLSLNDDEVGHGNSLSF